jgi:hypothetical protein
MKYNLTSRYKPKVFFIRKLRLFNEREQSFEQSGTKQLDSDM